MHKLARLSSEEHQSLLLYRENVEGGDPAMGHLSFRATALLLARGFVKRAGDGTPGDRGGYARAYIPTPDGLAWLDAMTQGPARAA
jgi:hypothetical protein